MNRWKVDRSMMPRGCAAIIDVEHTDAGSCAGKAVRWRQRFSVTLAALLVLSAEFSVATAQVRFASKERAFLQGYSAYKGRQYEIAVPALKFAAERGAMRAKFYLAKIYSDNSGNFTNHGRAYGLLREIFADHANVDPKDYRVAPFVAKSLISIARYERTGIVALNMKPNTKRALAFFDHAASYFNNEDAQFELAKHYLAGDGVEARVPYALNWLARLSKHGHAGAQAFLANLYWDGRYTKRDPVRALALITVAVENSQEEDRFWIEDVHQNIFCDAKRQTRQRVHQVVGRWRQRYGRIRPASASNREQLTELGGGTKRTCANGDMVGDLAAPPEKRGGTIEAGTAAVTARAGGLVQPSLDKHDAVTITRTKPNAENHKSLNGFALRETAAKDGRRVDKNTVVNARTKRLKKPNASLNGFVLQGSTNFGYSPKPWRSK